MARVILLRALLLLLIACAGRASAQSPVDASAQVSVTSSGFLFSRAAQVFTGQLTLTNRGASAIAGPFAVAFAELTPGVALAGADGVFAGNPFLRIGAPTSLGAGESLEIAVRFLDPASLRIDFRAIVYAGALPQPLSLACPSGTAFVGSAYASSLSASGGVPPYVFSITGGSLPTSLSLTDTTGAVAGTPSEKGLFAFTAHVVDSSAPTPLSGDASCSIDVPNRAPLAAPQSASTAEDSALVLTLAGTDPDGDALAFAIASGPAHGSLGAFGPVICSGTPSQCTRSVTYTPTANYAGADGFAFRVSDGTANSADAAVTLSVTAQNDPPSAAPRAYAAQANMRISIPAASGLLAGASDPDSAVLSVGSVGATTPAGGNVAFNAATGAFEFDPPPGATGNVSFSFTVCDDGAPPPVRCSAPTQASFSVAGPVIWFVNPAGAAGNGTLLAPFNTLAAANAALGASSNQRIFVYSGTSASGTGVALPASGWLVGQGALGASFDSLMAIAPPAGTIARPAIGTAAPVIQGTVQMNGSNTQVRGVRIQPPAGSAGLVAALAGPFTGLQVADVPSITTVGARAVDLSNASGVFSIARVDASGADVGIHLASLNASGGSFGVTGSGGACSSANPTCSGGTIANSTDSGIRLTNAFNVSFARMRINASGNFGLLGSSASALGIDTCLFDGAHGNVLDEGAISVTNWLGSGTINASEITGGASDNIRVVNTGGVLDRLTISGSTIRDNSTGSIGNHGLRFATNVASGAGSGVVMNVSVTGTTFRNHRANHVDTGATGQSQMNLVLSGNTFERISATGLTGAVNITGNHQSQVSFDVAGNTSTGALLTAFNFFLSNQTSAAASMIGRFRDNRIGTSGVANSGSAQGDGVSFIATGLATLTVNATGNTIRQFNNMGIGFTAGDTSPRVNATVTGNVVKEGSGFALNAIHFNMGSTAAGAVNACADIGGSTPALRNDIAGAIPPAAGGVELRVRQRNASVFRLPGLTGSVDAYLAGRNTVTGTTAVTFQGVFSGGVACPQAP